MSSYEEIGEKSSERSTRQKGLFSVNFRMIPAKIAFLLYGGLLGSHVPFLNVFFVSVGLSTSQSGFINGIRYLPSSLAGPLWGMVADYSGRRQLILVVLCIGSALPLFSMPWVSRLIHPIFNNATCSGRVNATLGKESTFPTLVDTPCVDLDTEEKLAIHTLFYVLLLIMLVGSVFVGPLPGFIDSIVMNLVKTSDDGSNYGVQRIFGSLGFSAASFVCGVAADHFKVRYMSRYTAVFCIFLPYTLLLIPFGCYIVGQARWDNKESQDGVHNETPSKHETSNKTMLSQLKYLFCQFDVNFFMLTTLVSGLACNIFQNFSLLLVNDVMKASETEMSLVFVIATISEVALFPFTTRIMNFLGGTSIAITLGIFSYFIRFLLMSYATHLWLMLLVQTLHAFGFALTWAAMMEYLHKVSPKEVLLTMFLIFQSIHFGVAALLANVVGGILYQQYGGQVLFRGKAIICGVWTLLMIIYYGSKHIRNRCLRSRRGYVPIDDEN